MDFVFFMAGAGFAVACLLIFLAVIFGFIVLMSNL